LWWERVGRMEVILRASRKKIRAHEAKIKEQASACTTRWICGL
jgi:hypothetical protein